MALVQTSYDESVTRFVQFMADSEKEIDAVLSDVGSGLQDT